MDPDRVRELVELGVVEAGGAAARGSGRAPRSRPRSRRAAAAASPAGRPRARAPARPAGGRAIGQQRAEPATEAALLACSCAWSSLAQRAAWSGRAPAVSTGVDHQRPIEELVGDREVALGARAAQVVEQARACRGSAPRTAARCAARSRRRPCRRRTSSTSSRTWFATLSRPSNIVNSTPSIVRCGLYAALTFSIVDGQRRQPLEREVLGLHRHDHAVGGDQRVERQQAERRRAVDHDVVVVARRPARARRRGTARGGRAEISSISAPTRSVVAGRDEQRRDLGRPDDVRERDVADERVVDRAARPCRADSRRPTRRCPADRSRRAARGSRARRPTPRG